MLPDQAVAALLHDLDAHAKPVAMDGNIAVYERDVPASSQRDRARALLFRIFWLTTRGLEIVVGRATSGSA